MKHLHTFESFSNESELNERTITNKEVIDGVDVQIDNSNFLAGSVNKAMDILAKAAKDIEDLDQPASRGLKVKSILLTM
jgi:hypothetical protein